MGWNSKIMRGVKALGGLFLLSSALLLPGVSANAQLPGDDCATVAADCYNGLCNAYLCLYVGYGTAVSGSIGLISTPNSISDPGGAGFGNLLLWNAPLVPVDVNGVLTTFYGSWLFVRVDGGAGGLAGISGTATGTGGDYIFGDPRTGIWLQAPTVVGNHIEASWQTVAHKVDAAGGGFSATFDPQVEIDMTATFVHDTVRFQFDIVNNSAGQSHTVGLAFVQDINVQPTIKFGQEIDGPLRLPNQPYLHHETLLSGGQVPDRWETSVQINKATATTTAQLHTLRGTLKPLTNAQTEPTTPSRFAYGRTVILDGFAILAGAKVRNFDQVWNFVPNPNVVLDAAVSSKSTDGSVVVFWDEQVVSPGQDLKRITYVGNADTENDFGSPLALAVAGPDALSFTTDRTTTPATVTATPSPFQISAYVQNLTDLTQSGGLAIGPINFFLDLPKGLLLASGDVATKNLTNVGPGAEGSVSWSVVVDPTAKVNGPLRYTVTASPNIGTGKSVQKTIEVPAPAALTLLSNATTQGLFKMASLPLLTGSATPSDIFGLPSNPPAIDVVRYNPVTAHYESQNSFAIGSAYWVRSELNTDASYVVDATKYPPLDNQVQPNATTLKINYPQGWNQIADPYVYGFKFSELQVFDTDTLTLTDIGSASDSLHQWILPAVYRYDTSDSSPANWHYVLEDNFGFVMAPYDGYWMLVKKANLQFIFPGVDTPGGQVTRAALVGAGVGTRAVTRTSLNNWKLQLTAKNNMSTDVANIGVAAKATNTEDIYKYAKPPTPNKAVQVSIVHTDWKTTNLMQDMRAPGNMAQSWNIQVTSPAANDTVRLSWSDLTRSVPRNYKLMLVDKDTNTRQALQNNSSYTVNTGTSGVRQLQIVATPITRAGSVLITNFDFVQPGASGGRAVQAVTINYALSQDADTQIVVRDGNGRVIRTLTPTRSVDTSTTGAGQAIWDLRDKSGTKITTGTYSIELNALSSGGQRARQIKPFVISR